MKRRCPLCDHEFQGNGWDGIDAHWRSKHDHILPYEQAWPLIEAGHFPPWPRFQRANIPNLTTAELWEGTQATAEAIAHVAREQAAIAGGHAGASNAEVRNALVAAHQRLWERLRIEYDAYLAELDRRLAPQRGQP